MENNKRKMDLSIKPIETSKDRIQNPALAEDELMYIPPLGSVVIICGKTGSGKSTLLVNLLNDGRFYGPSEEKTKGWFDKKFIFSPTANGDDIQKSLKIKPDHVFTDLEEAPELLKVILDSQSKKLEKGDGANKVEQYAFIFDDIIGDTKFLNAREFTRCSYQVRHVNGTTFICTQHYKRIPRLCRQQAGFVFFFQGSASEVEMIVDDFAPPQYSKNEFKQIINDATKEKFSFLTINMKVGWNIRFRKNLDEIINLDRLESFEPDPNKKRTKNYDADINQTQVIEKAAQIIEDGKQNEQKSNEFGLFSERSTGKRINW